MRLLEESQLEAFPFEIDAFGATIAVHRGVFSPKHFHGWETFTSHFPDVAGRDVLEVGSGTGVTSVVLARRGARRVVAVDINPLAVANSALNVERQGLKNVEVRESDVLSAIRAEETFDIIYWNLPFIYVPRRFQFDSDLEKALFDPGYHAASRFLRDARKHLRPDGRVLIGLGDFAHLRHFLRLSRAARYEVRLVARQASHENGAVEFQLYSLQPTP